jgi:hypothetical protein
MTVIGIVPTQESLKTLQAYHPNLSADQVLILALATAATNEGNTFVMYNLSDYKKRNPNFLTYKSTQQ